MSVDEILIQIRCNYKKFHVPPKASRMKSVAQECQRKIGSWRKALWLAGVLGNQRKRILPRLKFRSKMDGLKITPQSSQNLQKLMPKNPHLKQKLKHI